jgi:D-sedoheptulose 7-phosphate isomerase
MDRAIMSDVAMPGAASAEAERMVAALNRSAALKLVLAQNVTQLLAIVDRCEAAIRSGNKLIFCGNGGSAADAQHLAAEMLIRLRSSVPRQSWPALALTIDPVALTAAGNDFGFDQVFERPLRGLGKAGDVLFGITSSGRSANVLGALRAAREMQIATVGFLGGDGGDAQAVCDHVLIVPDFDTMRVQECHITLGHIVLTALEDRLVGTSYS